MTCHAPSDPDCVTSYHDTSGITCHGGHSHQPEGIPTGCGDTQRMFDMSMSEDTRYKVYRIGAHAAWWTSFVWLLALSYANLSQNPMEPRNAFQILSGIGIVFLIGVAIACGMTLSRMRLTKAITGVFETGMAIASTVRGNSNACVITTDLEGVILSAEKAHFIGWPDEKIVGKTLDSIIPDAYLRVNDAALRQYRDMSSDQQASDSALTVTFNLPIMSEEGRERPVRITIARLGDTLIKSLTPIKEL